MSDVSETLDPATATEERKDKPFEAAGQWRLIWMRFRRHRLAYWSGVIVAFIYFVALFASFLAPTTANYYSARYTYAPPQSIHLFGTDASGESHLFHTYDYTSKVDPLELTRTYTVDESKAIPLGFFVRGEPYKFWGLFEADRHFFGPKEPGRPFYLFGADRLGRDVFSRTVIGTQVSMSIGLIGVALSLVIGIVLGGISGIAGGWADEVIQRLIELLKSIPTIPLWLGLAAAIPLNISPLIVYLWITIILSLIGWTDIARIVRGRFMVLKTEDFVTAARLDGCSRQRIIWRHMVPSFASHLIASTTLAIPAMILAETALSFLGVGLRPPVVSWGVLLKESQSILALSNAPWLFLPGIAIIVTVLALNFLGDGLRDAADPYGK